MLSRNVISANQALRQVLRSTTSTATCSPFLQTRAYANKSNTKPVGFAKKSEKFKRDATTPNKRAGSIHPFAHTAAYSKHHTRAETIAEGTGSQILDTVTLFSADQIAPENATVFKYSKKANTGLTRLGSYKRDQKNELFKERSTLIRGSSSTEMFNIIKAASASSSTSNRFFITGARGVGKSTALAQAHAFAIEQDYVVIHISRPHDLVAGTSDVALSRASKDPKNTNAPVFNQPMYVQKLMRKIAKANEEILSSIQLSKDYTFETSGSHRQIQFSKSTSLYDMLIQGRTHMEKCEIFTVFLQELASQSNVPVLFTIDDFQVFVKHPYAVNRDVDNKPIYHGNLQVPKLFLDFFSGAQSFKKGAVIASVSNYTDGYTLTHGLNEAEPYPYAKPSEYDPVLASKLRDNGGVKKIEIKPLTLSETSELLSFYENAKILHEPVTEEYIQEKYFLSGNGNPTALLKSCVEVY